MRRASYVLHAPGVELSEKHRTSKPEAYGHAKRRYEKAEGKGRSVDEVLAEPFLRDRLNLNLYEWQHCTLDYKTVMLELAYHDGKNLAEWVAMNSAKGSNRG